MKEQPVEGCIYVLSNFKVKQYVGHETYRSLRVDKHVYFTEHTKCVKDTEVGLQIEPFAVDLFALEEIVKNADDNRFLIGINLLMKVAVLRYVDFFNNLKNLLQN